jgi:MFS transporter, DHA1 family, multidrug resistance protein
VQESAKVFSKLMLVVGVSPIIAPTLGGYLSAHFGWHSIFIVLAAMSAVILITVHFILPDTHKGNPHHSLKPSAIAGGYLKVVKEPQFFTYAFTGAIGASGLYAFIAGSPEVFLQYFKVSEQAYGGIFAIVAGGLILSSQINSVLLRKYNSAQIIRVALLIQCFIGICFFIAAVTHWLSLIGAIAFILLFLSCQGFCFPNSSALSMAPFTKNAGSASALMGAIQMSFGALSAALVGALGNNTAVPMAAGMACCAIGSYFMLRVDGRIVKYKPTPPEVQEETIDGFINAGQ